MIEEEAYTFYNVHTQPFSNFYSSPFVAAGFSYPTAEHYYQSKKFQGSQLEQQIRDAPTIEQAHLLGQQYHPNFDYEEWDQCREQVYFTAALLKFEQNKELGGKLR